MPPSDGAAETVAGVVRFGRSDPMQSATTLDATRRLARRELLVGGFTFLMAVVGLASLAAVAIAGTGAGLRVPGVGAGGGGGGAGGGTTLVAVGYGEAAVAAETATLQLLLGPSEFGGMTVGDGSGGGGEAGAPGDAERRSAEPIVGAIQGAGVAAGDVSVRVSPALASGYYGPVTSGFGVRIDVAVRQPTTETLNRVVDAAGAAAIEENLRLSQVGVAYAVADCAGLERQARERAIADARVGAEEQAALLGTTLGDLILASDDEADATDGAATDDGCGPPTRSASDAPFDLGSGITVPSFDLARPAEGTARVRVSLTFALTEG